MKTFWIVCFSGLAAQFYYSCTQKNAEDVKPQTPEQPITVTSANLSTDVMPILNRYNCIACHSASNPGGGIALQPYNNLRASALDGSLYGSMAHQSGYSPMPKGGGKATALELAIIKKWIEDGAQDN